MIYTNIQGLTNNFTQLEILTETENPEFIVLSETHLTKSINDEEIALKNYNNISSLSNSNRTGGVTLYLKKHWSLVKNYEIKEDSKYWILWCLAKYKSIKILISAIYRSPSCQPAEFCDKFGETLEEICEQNCDVLITGDFNIDWSKDSFYKQQIERTLNDNGMKQIVKSHTRITENTKTLIDYVVTNTKNIAVQNSFTNKISDHEIIEIIIEDNNIKKEHYEEKLERFRYNKIAFSREINSIIKFEENKELNENVFHFDKCFETTIQKFTKNIKIKAQSNTKGWYNREISAMKNEKIRKYQIAKYINTPEAWANYKSIRNLYKVKIENQKNNYINDQIRNATDQKQMWREIKNLVLKESQTVINSVIFNGNECTNKQQIANNFNEYFINSVKLIRESIGNVQYKNHIQRTNKIFKFREITIAELKSVVKELKNKPDFNKISTKIILDNWNTTGEILRKIINQSIKTGIFPESWKVSMVSPIEKVPKTNKCEEFRPINTLKTCEKILEKVVKNQLENYFEENLLLSQYQSGFRKKYSCETAVNYVINQWKYIGKNKRIMALFLDFQRAFETIDRNIMLQKLYMYGIRHVELEWFKSYLDNRQQTTKVNGMKSDGLKNEFGVPQGSILGALLFIIYINDMPNIVQKCKIVLYADDTLIYAEGDSESECRDKMNCDVNNITKWLKMNKLKLNEDKTKLIEINMSGEINFEINNKIIEKVEKIKYLGFIIDKELKFRDHIDYICKKIGKKIGFFKRIRNKISITTAINIYNTIIKPHFEFGSTILYTCCLETQIERMQKLQNKAMRCILKCNRYTPISVMLDSLQWLNIKQRLEMNTLCFVQKMKMGNAPEYLCENIKYVGEVQPYELRNSENFRLQRTTSTAMQRSLFYKGLKLYNKIPYDLKTERNYYVFKRQCVNFVKNNLIFWNP